jgi:hypothetical protein
MRRGYLYNTVFPARKYKNPKDTPYKISSKATTTRSGKFLIETT